MASPQPAVPSLTRMLSRAAVLRCPRCGSGGLFRRWLTMVETCPRCALTYEHEEGYWTGAMMINLAVTMGVFLVVFVGYMVLAWPDVPWTGVLIAVIAANVITPIVFYPFSKTLWVAGDLAFRRAERHPEH